MTWTYWRGKQHTEEDLPPLIRIARSTSWSSWLLFLRTNLVSIPGGSSTAMSSHTQMSLIAIPLHQSTRLRTSPSLAAMITQPLWNTSADTSRSLGLLQGTNTGKFGSFLSHSQGRPLAGTRLWLLGPSRPGVSWRNSSMPTSSPA